MARHAHILIDRTDRKSGAKTTETNNGIEDVLAGPGRKVTVIIVIGQSLINS